jgi:L-alanine-DL-glutamate epimerase-like enolase superfamily enzyme
VETDEGLTGWGEAFSNAGWQSTCTALAQIIAPRVVGRDPSQIAQIQSDLHRGLYNTGRSGPTVFAISGLDIALWDLAAKRAGPAALQNARRQRARHAARVCKPSALWRCRRGGAQN